MVTPQVRAMVFGFFFITSMVFVWRSFYLMRIDITLAAEEVVVPIALPILKEKGRLTSPRRVVTLNTRPSRRRR
jgi:hypothetical protein